MDCLGERMELSMASRIGLRDLGFHGEGDLGRGLDLVLVPPYHGMRAEMKRRLSWIV